MTTILVLALGATAGAAARYYGSLWALERFGPAFPYGTLAINLLGSLILGFFLNLAAARHDIGPQLRLLVATGFCGSFTTFSTFSFEAVAMLNAGRYLACGLYLFGSMALGVAAVMLGALLVRLVA